MFPIDYLVAAALLTAPPNTAEHPASARIYSGIAPTLQELAIAWEILDPHELQFTFTRQVDYPGDMKLLRQRFQELHDAPPVHDSMRFPSRQLIGEMLTFNRNYREHLEKCKIAGTTPNQDFQQALQEVDRLYQIWDAIRDSRCDYCYIPVRRSALKKVRDLIGEDAFYSGNFPPHVPLWRFQRID
jgi:hypothetical protein